VIACIALMIALGGTSYAAAVALPRNSVTTVQVKDRSLLAKDFKQGQLPRGAPGPAGPAGAAGPAGPTGPAGPAGGGAAAKWALVNAAGTIVAQSGGISLTSHATGQYILNFGSVVTGKPIMATSALAGDEGGRGTVAAGACGGTQEGVACSSGNDTNHVIVRTFAVGNITAEDHPFYVAVFG
jgi:hypothetical protein